MITSAHNFRDIFTPTEANNAVKGIVIPIVQRDYAQGRKAPEVKRIRDRFLAVLYDAVVNDKPTTLDFIYGNVEGWSAAVDYIVPAALLHCHARTYSRRAAGFPKRVHL